MPDQSDDDQDPCGTYIVDKIPDANVGEVMAGFRLDSPTSLNKTKNADGTWKVTAVFPPCPGGTNPVSTKNYSG